MINRSEAEWVHIDIMDGVFVPNISFGFPVLKYVAKLTDKPLDVHLMIVNPEKFIPEVKALGAHTMNVHYEACTHLHGDSANQRSWNAAGSDNQSWQLLLLYCRISFRMCIWYLS